MAKFNKGDIVRMKQEVLNEFDREGAWHFHEHLRDKELTVYGVEVYGSNFEWTDYILEETPFVLAEQWLELVRKNNEEERECQNLNPETESDFETE